MAAWITPARVGLLVRQELDSDEYMIELIDHVQGLAEVEIGAQTEPITAGLAATFTEIVARIWRATKAAETSPQGYQSERIDDYQYEFPAAGPMLSGFGLTDREKRALRKAAGQSMLSVVSTTRNAIGAVEMAEPYEPVIDLSDPDLA